MARSVSRRGELQDGAPRSPIGAHGPVHQQAEVDGAETHEIGGDPPKRHALEGEKHGDRMASATTSAARRFPSNKSRTSATSAPSARFVKIVRIVASTSWLRE